MLSRMLFGCVVLLSGCATPPVYRVRMDLPWPDEWAAGPRASDRMDLPISEEAVWWHRMVDWSALRRHIAGTASRYPGVLVMVRESFADRRGKSGKSRHALAFLEVRVTAWPLPISRAAAADDWSFAGVPLRHVVDQCAARIGEAVRLDGGLDGTIPIDFKADHMGPAEALACILLRNDLYFAPVCLGASVLRSYEYRSEQAFRRSVEERMREASRARPHGPYVVMSMRRWVDTHEAELRRLNLWNAPGSVRSSSRDDVGRAERAGRYLRRLLEIRLERISARPSGEARERGTGSVACAPGSDKRCETAHAHLPRRAPLRVAAKPGERG